MVSIGTILAGQEKQGNSIYTIDGMKIKATSISNLPTGIYVVNNKKVVIK